LITINQKEKAPVLRGAFCFWL